MRIDLVTTTRAEYGLLRPLIKAMAEDQFFDMRLLVTGTHLSERHGLTYKEIENDGFSIAKRIPILSSETGAIGVSDTMANAISKFTAQFIDSRPDFLIVDGDRYETLGICIAAVNCNIPIIHIGGGATTEGAADECYRHAMTKMSYLHFPNTEDDRRRIIQLGENPARVFAVGALGIENILRMDYLTKDQLSDQIGWPIVKPFAVVTFHPVTLENNTCEEQLNELLYACIERQDMQFIFTKANADKGGDVINRILDNYAVNSTNAICIPSLGAKRYLSALKYAEFVMGNSSSGITEAPSFHLPTINIGDRQRGREQAASTINCHPVKDDILKAINIALSPEFKSICENVVNPYGDGNTSVRIISHIKDYANAYAIEIKKKFYDLQ